MIPPWAIYTASLAVIGGIGRIWVKYRAHLVAKRAFGTPLFDAALLDSACLPQSSDDDPDVLAEIRQTLAHLNRESYAQELWNLDKQLADYYNKIPKASRPTMRRVLIRLLTANDRWLQIVAARTCADLSLREAVPPLTALIEMGDSMNYSAEKTEYSSKSHAQESFKQALVSSLATIQKGSKDEQSRNFGL